MNLMHDGEDHYRQIFKGRILHPLAVLLLILVECPELFVIHLNLTSVVQTQICPLQSILSLSSANFSFSK